MELPIYCMVEGRPVKVIERRDGEIAVLAYDSAREEFVTEDALLPRIMMQDERVLELTEEEFEDQLRRVRRARGRVG